jgi:hypothetical protein
MPDDRLRFGDILAALSLLGGSFLDVAIAAASPPPPPPPPAGSELGAGQWGRGGQRPVGRSGRGEGDETTLRPGPDAGGGGGR